MDTLGSQPSRGLIADDEAVVRDVLEDYLSEFGYFVRTVDNGFDAVEQLLTDSYDFALIDINMPGMHGLEVLEQLQRAGKALPVLLISGYSSLRNHEAIRGYPYLRFVRKPVKLHQLALELAQVFGMVSSSLVPN